MDREAAEVPDEIESCLHEMRNLLVAGNYAKLLLQERSGPLTTAQRQHLEIIHGNTKRMKELLARLDHLLHA